MSNKDYIIIRSTCARDLAQRVNRRIQTGYVPQGSLVAAVDQFTDYNYYSQAMISDDLNRWLNGKPTKEEVSIMIDNVIGC